MRAEVWLLAGVLSCYERVCSVVSVDVLDTFRFLRIIPAHTHSPRNDQDGAGQEFWAGNIYQIEAYNWLGFEMPASVSLSGYPGHL